LTFHDYSLREARKARKLKELAARILNRFLLNSLKFPTFRKEFLWFVKKKELQVRSHNVNFNQSIKKSKRAEEVKDSKEKHILHHTYIKRENHTI
jgi:hypothetical protein